MGASAAVLPTVIVWVLFAQAAAVIVPGAIGGDVKFTAFGAVVTSAPLASAPVAHATPGVKGLVHPVRVVAVIPVQFTGRMTAPLVIVNGWGNCTRGPPVVAAGIALTVKFVQPGPCVPLTVIAAKRVIGPGVLAIGGFAALIGPYPGAFGAARSSVAGTFQLVSRYTG